MPLPNDFAQRAQQAQRTYDTFAVTHSLGRVQEVWVRMRDGARMRTHVYLPQGDGPFPTIVQRSCYPAQQEIYHTHGVNLAQRGYAYVLQYCRGTGGSEGDWLPNENERHDGLDTLSWLCAQPFVDAIGYWGSSYLALTGWCMADAFPEKVKGAYLTLYGPDRYASAYQSGMFRHDILTGWAMGNAGFPIQADYLASCRYRPHHHVDTGLWGRPLPWYRDYVENPRRSDAYWQSGFWKQLSEIPQRVRVPLYIREGWYDHHLGSALVGYRSLPASVRAHTVLELGAYKHRFAPCLPGHEEARDLRIDDIAPSLAFFDEILKQKKQPTGRVQAYVLGADRWVTSDAFPLPTQGERVFYLSGGTDGVAHPLTDAPVPGEASYVYDPEHPVPSCGGESLFDTFDMLGTQPQPAPGARSDVLSFLSEPLAAPVAVGGPMRVRLRVRSTAPDTAFTAKICEVKPDGTAYHVRGSITSLAFRDEAHAPVPYTPGTPVDIEITMWDIAYQFPAGARIRVDISSSNFPEYAIHSNTSGIWSMQAKTQPATQTLLLGKGCQLILPLLAL